MIGSVVRGALMCLVAQKRGGFGGGRYFAMIGCAERGRGLCERCFAVIDRAENGWGLAVTSGGLWWRVLEWDALY